MARRRQEDDDISLFPFLSILACVIGVLTLLISALALSQMDSSAVAAAEDYEELLKVAEEQKETLTALSEEIDKRQAELSDTNAQQMEQLKAAQSELTNLRTKLEELRQTSPEMPDKLDPLDGIAKSVLDEMEAQLAEVLAKIEALKKQIADRKLPPEEGRVQVLPAGSGKAKTPHFIECAAGAVVLHRNGKRHRVPVASIKEDKQLATMVKDVAAKQNDSLLFLVRTDGISAYQHARRLAIEAGAHYGKLPVAGKGRLDLSRFQRAPKK